LPRYGSSLSGLDNWALQSQRGLGGYDGQIVVPGSHKHHFLEIYSCLIFNLNKVKMTFFSRQLPVAPIPSIKIVLRTVLLNMREQKKRLVQSWNS
jgi:hypothetical protein